jgi:hypothetical protein
MMKLEEREVGDRGASKRQDKFKKLMDGLDELKPGH